MHLVLSITRYLFLFRSFNLRRVYYNVRQTIASEALTVFVEGLDGLGPAPVRPQLDTYPAAARRFGTEVIAYVPHF